MFNKTEDLHESLPSLRVSQRHLTDNLKVGLYCRGKLCFDCDLKLRDWSQLTPGSLQRFFRTLDLDRDHSSATQCSRAQIEAETTWCTRGPR